jgi:hypothetical protein
VSIRLLNCHTRNPPKSCISRSTSQSHSLGDSISQHASLFTYHLVRTGYSPIPSSRITLITPKTLACSPTDYASSGSGSEHRTATFAELAIDPTQLTSSQACHRHVTLTLLRLLRPFPFHPHPPPHLTCSFPSLVLMLVSSICHFKLHVHVHMIHIYFIYRTRSGYTCCQLNRTEVVLKAICDGKGIIAEVPPGYVHCTSASPNSHSPLSTSLQRDIVHNSNTTSSRSSHSSGSSEPLQKQGMYLPTSPTIFEV